MNIIEALIVAVVTAGVSSAVATYVATKVLAVRVKGLEHRVHALQEDVQGSDGLNVRVAVLERANPT